MNKHIGWVAFGAALLSAPAHAGDFDAQGFYVNDPNAVAQLDFGPSFDAAKDYYTGDDQPPECEPAFTQIEAGDALDGGHYLHVDSNAVGGCGERFVVTVPPGKRAYRASAWVRHGGIDVQFNVAYAAESGVPNARAKMAPTGRVTSDGWLELMSNAISVDGDALEVAYLRTIDFDDVGSDVDAFELVPAGPYVEQLPCAGLGDDACSAGQVCIFRQCRDLTPLVPPLPSDLIRNEMVDSMQGQLRIFYGGRKTRVNNLPAALAQLDDIRAASDAWTFWNGWANAYRKLQDWHTRASGSVQGFSRDKRMSACFIQGDADLTHAAWPSHPSYPDVLVSHVGSEGNQGLAPGDRLVSIDGMHPVAWAFTLRDVEWGYWQANTDGVYAELLEGLRSDIIQYARQYAVLHCDASSGTCDALPTTQFVAALPDDTQNLVRCDNRPFYHFGPANNPGANHNVGFNFYKGPIVEASAEEAIYGLLWDTLYGDGDPNGFVNANLKGAFAEFKSDARGVVLDHRAGNGGTLDGAETATFLIRPPEQVLVFMSPIQLGGFDGPTTPAEGVALFDAFKGFASMTAGSDDWDPDMPVALLIHRDGSASDFMPYAFKGAPKARIFGPAATAGAFSTFWEMTYWGGITFRFGSGDSIGADGATLIGHGAEPDVVVMQKQSDSLAGLDTIHEAALAWLRTELKP